MKEPIPGWEEAWKGGRKEKRGWRKREGRDLNQSQKSKVGADVPELFSFMSTMPTCQMLYTAK